MNGNVPQKGCAQSKPLSCCAPCCDLLVCGLRFAPAGTELYALWAQAFGGDAVDLGASLFSLGDAERAVGTLFADLRRFDLIDMITCTDPEDAVAFG
ncbi:MAG: hypothetical protein AAFS07_15195 [Pseudomonadota bacterium]